MCVSMALQDVAWWLLGGSFVLLEGEGMGGAVSGVCGTLWGLLPHCGAANTCSSLHALYERGWGGGEGRAHAMRVVAWHGGRET
jgi:hypothetical protein